MQWTSRAVKSVLRSTVHPIEFTQTIPQGYLPSLTSHTGIQVSCMRHLILRRTALAWPAAWLAD